MKQTSHYNQGNSRKIALVFSCPGQEEDKLGRPTAGQTGENLDTFLESLLNKTTVNRYDYRITNAFDKVFYESKDGRTEATTEEILADSNLKRLYEEVKDIEDVIIGFGKKAKMALDAVAKKYLLKVKIVETKHLGLQALNRYSVNNPQNLEGNDLKKHKIRLLANDVKSVK